MLRETEPATLPFVRNSLLDHKRKALRSIRKLMNTMSALENTLNAVMLVTVRDPRRCALKTRTDKAIVIHQNAKTFM